ncbi:integrase catalytic subunit [Klebsiella variicola]|nr:integrase catalytic subunit [Klebsiella variicola]
MHGALVCGRLIWTFNVGGDFNREALSTEIDHNSYFS